MSAEPKARNAEWTTVRLGDVATIDRRLVQPTDIKGGAAYVGLEHIESGGRTVTPQRVQQGDLASTKFAFTPDHVLYGKLRPYLAKIALPEFTGVCSTDILPVLPGADLDRRYLCHYLRQPKVVEYANSLTAGANLPRLSPSALANFQIPLPPIAEQKRIAAILDKADDFRRRRREAMGLNADFLRSLFLEMFGDPVTNPKGWRRVALSDLLSNIDSGWSPPCLNRAAQGEEWGVLKLGAVTRCEYNPAENKALPPHVRPDPSIEVKPGDLLFSRKNTYDLVAASALVWETPPRLMMSDLIFRLRLRPDAQVDSCFLHHLLICRSKRREIQSLASGAAASMPNISKARLASSLVELPPLELQRQFARQVALARKLNTTQLTASSEAESLFTSLQQRAFTGDL